MNVSLPDTMRSFVEQQVEAGRYGSTSEYVRDLIRRDQDRHELRDLILKGARSALGPAVDESYFDQLRSRARSVR